MAKIEDFATHRLRAGLDDTAVLAQLLAAKGLRKRTIERLDAGEFVRERSAWNAQRYINSHLKRQGLDPISEESVLRQIRG